MLNDIKENSGCLGFLFPFLKNTKSTNNSDLKFETYPEAEPLPYRVRDDFLSPAEFSFYKILTTIVGRHLTIQVKVRLADIFFVAQPNKNRAYLGKISQRHLDFLGCDPTTMKPLFGIELDDASHNQEKRQVSDHFLDSVFEAAGLPLLRIPVHREYNTREIELQIKQFLKEKIKLATPPVQPIEAQQNTSVPLCPKCGIPMILRTVSKGDHKGKQFYGCKNFPQCREMKPVSV